MNKISVQYLETALAETEALFVPMMRVGVGPFLVNRVVDMITLISPNLSAEQAERWASVAIKALAEQPADFLDEALKEAMLNCRWPSEVIPFVDQHIGELTLEYRGYATNLAELIAIARG